MGRVLSAIAASAITKLQLSTQLKGKPILLFWAETDPVIPRSRAAGVMAALSGALPTSASAVKLVVFPGLNTHVPELQQPKLFHEALSQFFAI